MDEARIPRKRLTQPKGTVEHDPAWELSAVIHLTLSRTTYGVEALKGEAEGVQACVTGGASGRGAVDLESFPNGQARVMGSRLVEGRYAGRGGRGR